MTYFQHIGVQRAGLLAALCTGMPRNFGMHLACFDTNYFWIVGSSILFAKPTSSVALWAGFWTGRCHQAQRLVPFIWC